MGNKIINERESPEGYAEQRRDKNPPERGLNYIIKSVFINACGFNPG